MLRVSREAFCSEKQHDLCDNEGCRPVFCFAPEAGRAIMGDLFQPTHLLVIAVVLLVLFGGKKLPELGKGLGEGLRGFKEGIKGVTEDEKPGETAHTVTPKAEESVK
jgi:sec-independent protein translocase protein TatA